MAKLVNDNEYNVNEYRKFSWEEVKSLVLQFTNWEEITRTKIIDTFTNTASQDSSGKYKISPPTYRITDYFDLPAKTLPNQLTPIKDTTFGIFIYNSLVINNAFHSKFPYFNEALDIAGMKKLFNIISENLIKKTITVAEFGEFTSAHVWLGYMTEIAMPGCSLNFLKPNTDVIKEKQRLFKENSELMSQDLVSNEGVVKYARDIEKPLIDKAAKLLEDDPSMRLYDLKKPSFSNNYKNSFITNGPLLDAVTGKLKINPNAYVEGINKESFSIMANKAMNASYSRGVATQSGGADAKYLNVAMQNIIIGPDGSDCKTEFTIDWKLTDNINFIQYNYCMIDGKPVLMTPDFIRKNKGKTVKMRVPLFCQAKEHICETCFGTYIKMLGITNVGLTSSNAANKVMNLSMKKMHNMAVKFYKNDIKKDMDFNT